MKFVNYCLWWLAAFLFALLSRDWSLMRGTFGKLSVQRASPKR